MGRVVIGGLAPHPPLLIPAIGGSELEKIRATREAMEELGSEFAAAGPNTLVVITPHGRVLKNRINIITKRKLRGNFGRFGYQDRIYEVENDPEFIERIRKQGADFDLKFVEDTGQERGLFGDKGLDHGILVPLHYLQEAGAEFSLIPVSMGIMPFQDLLKFGRAVRQAAEDYDKKIAVLASGDLSHRLTPDAPAGYNPRGKVFDRKVVEALEDMDVDKLLNLDEKLIEKAGECGLKSLLMMLGVFLDIPVRSRVLSYEGPFGVGYAVAVITPKEAGEEAGLRTEKKQEITEQNRVSEGNSYVRIARRAVELYCRKGKTLTPPPGPSPEFDRQAGVFVTIKKEGELRGCIGTVEPTEPDLARELIKNAIQAGFRDPRFPPISEVELPSLKFSVDILNEPESVADIDELDPQKYGVIVQKGGRSGLLLPAIEGINTPEEQVNIAARKAGIFPNEDFELKRFSVERHGEAD